MIMLGHLIQLTSNRILFIIFFTTILACNTSENNTSPTIEELPYVLETLLSTNSTEGVVLFKNELFTGFAVTFKNQTDFKSKIRYIKGIKDGPSLKWFDNGELSYEALYKVGKLNGVATSWWKSGNKRSQSFYEDGVSQGEQLQWYRSGALFKKINLVDGKEEGIQQSYRENGKLYNNYEAKNGRIFGLKRSKLCFKLDNQEIELTDNEK